MEGLEHDKKKERQIKEVMQQLIADILMSIFTNMDYLKAFILAFDIELTFLVTVAMTMELTIFNIVASRKYTELY